MHWGYFPCWGGEGTFWGGIVMVIFWVAVLVGLVFLVRYLVQQPRAGGPGETPLDILKKRYAKGEIDKEEFEEKKKVLGGSE